MALMHESVSQSLFEMLLRIVISSLPHDEAKDGVHRSIVLPTECSFRGISQEPFI